MAGIKFRRNLKENLTPELGEIVYAVDEKEWGLGTSNGTVWRKHEILHKNLYLQGNGVPDSILGDIGMYYFDIDGLVVYQKQQSGWEEIVYPISQSYFDKFLPKGTISDYNDITKLIKTDGSVKTDAGYIPIDSQDVLTRKTAEGAFGFLKTDGSTQMVDGYVAVGDGVVTKNDLNGINIVLPTTEPTIDGTLWNNNGNLEVYQTLGLIRYYTTASSLDFSILGTLQTTNGYVDVVSNDNPTLQSSQETITKIEVLKYGNRTSWSNLAYDCTNLTEFVVTATDASKVSDFSNAWNHCTSLTSFPQLDVSSGTDFGYAWRYCSSLTSFPQLDVSSGTNFLGAWYHCSSLTSFPQLDVSSGTNFGYAWFNCTSLPHCPAGNEVTIPQGATTTNMCVGI